MKLSEIMKNGRTAFTFEIFPPKKDMPIETIYKTLDGLQGLHPDFISVTYGAGGSAADTKGERSQSSGGNHNKSERSREKGMEKQKRKLQRVLMGVVLFVAAVFCVGWMTVQNAKASDEEEVPLSVFTDDTVRGYISQEYDANGDDMLSSEEIECIMELNFDDCNITTLAGIEVLFALERLSCSFNNLEVLDVSGNPELEALYCNSNRLSVLDVSNNPELSVLNCSYNQLTELIVAGAALGSLDCSYNNLTSLDVSENTNLWQLLCYHNQLTQLVLGQNQLLGTVFCNENKLDSIDISNVTLLNELATNYVPSCACVSVADDREELVYFWSDDEEKGIFQVDSRTVVITDPALTYCTVSFDSKGGSEVAPAITLSGYGIMRPADPTREGMIFSGWYSDPGFNTKFLFNDEDGTVEESITLYAKWDEPVVIDENTFPDQTFREYVSQTIDTDCDGVLSLEERDSVTSITVSYSGIYSLSGIEVFQSLEQLDCDYCNLTSLDVSKNSKLTSLSVEGNELEELDVSSNMSLAILDCGYNKLSELNLGNIESLRTLYCSHNALTALDVSHNEGLFFLDCNSNLLEELVLPASEVLERIWCENNYLATVDVSKCDLISELAQSAPTQTYNEYSDGTTRFVNCWNEGTCIFNADWDTEVIADPALTYCMVSFNSNGGSTVAPVKTISGLRIDKPADPIKTDVVFCGWCKDEDLEMPFEFGPAGDSVTESITLYAKWSASVVISETFDDPFLRDYVSGEFDINGNGILSPEEIEAVVLLDLSDCEISSLKGIEVFTELQSLSCARLGLGTIDVSNNTKLRNLDCSGNALTSLDVTDNPNLEVLICRNNQLTELDLTENESLRYLECENVGLSSVDVTHSTVLNDLAAYGDVTLGSWYLEGTSERIAFEWADPDQGWCLRVDSATVVITNPALTYSRVSFDSRGGSDVADVNTLQGYPIVMPENPTYEGMELYGWYTDTELTNRFVFGVNGDVVNENITLYAKWYVPVDVATAFPDSGFREYVLTYIDTDDDGTLTVPEIEAITSITLYDYEVSSLVGIEHFHKRTFLDTAYNALTSLDVSQNTMLESLYCRNAGLTALNVTQNTKLKNLDVSGSQLTALTVTGNELLEELNCSYNNISGLDVSKNANLRILQCSGNPLLSSIDVSKNSVLEVLECEATSITQVNVTENEKLTNLICRGLQLTELDVSNCPALTHLCCEGNKLSSLDIRNCQVLNDYVGQIAVKREFRSFDIGDYMCDCWHDDTWEKEVSIDSATQLITSPALNYVTVSFDTDGGSEVPSVVVLAGFTIDQSVVPTRENSEFLGWYTDANHTNPFWPGYYEGTAVNSDMTVYAKWGRQISIGTATFPDKVFRDYVLEYIDLNSDGVLSEAEIEATTGIWINYAGVGSLDGIELLTSLKYLYCVGNNIESLDLSGNPALEAICCENNPLETLDIRNNPILVNLVSQDTVKQVTMDTGDGQVQMSYYWNKDEDDDYLSINASTVLITTPALTYVTISFDCNGGNEQIAPMIALVGQTIISPTNPTKAGADFYGWCTDAEGTTGFDFGVEGTPVNSNITLYAKWLEYKPEILVQPEDLSVEAGAVARFEVQASGEGTLKYRWQFQVPNSTTWTNSGAEGCRTATVTFPMKAGMNG
ncbi:MAG: InlB B-repeat-containing protein, partial [Lachnospiraceae bacterium]|nr:InlB B-repeat-containing protein [Lachnospiraceae bacterium]